MELSDSLLPAAAVTAKMHVRCGAGRSLQCSRDKCLGDSRCWNLLSSAIVCTFVTCGETRNKVCKLYLQEKSPWVKSEIGLS
jgi:hypothetical protein